MMLAFIEHDRGVLNPASLQMLTCARKVAQEDRVPVHAVLIGGDIDAFRDSLRKHGVAHIYHVKHPSLEEYAPAAWARSVTQLIQAHSPSGVMAAGSDRGNEVLAWIGAITRLPMAANCVEVRSSGANLVRQRWGGSLLEEATLNGQTRLLTIALFAFEAVEVADAAETTLEVVEPPIEEKDLRVRVASREETASAGVNLQTARVVIGGGRGVGSAEGFCVLEELAGVLGGAVGGSRVATNNGWRPHSVQVGLTGNRIAPELYIACGISGAIQHLVGCKAAKHILVINKDRDAPFFRRADYGVTGDLHEIIPALIEEIRRRKAVANAP